MRDRYILAGMLLFVTVLAVSFNSPSASKEKIDLEEVVMGSNEINLAKNPSFEDGDEVGPTGWESVIWLGSASLSWNDLKQNVRTGNRSLMIRADSSDVKSAWRTTIQESVDVKPALRYDASVWVKIDRVAPKGVRLILAWFNSEGEWVSISSGQPIQERTVGWREIWVRGVAPENADKCSIELHLDDEGVVFFDDIRLEESLPSSLTSDDRLFVCTGLLYPSVKANNSVLTIKGRFVSPEDEFVVFDQRNDIDTFYYPYYTLSWRTSTSIPGDPGIFLQFVTTSGRLVVHPLGFSDEWATSTINLHSLTKGENVTNVRFMLNDWDDSVSDGLFFVQARDIHLSSRVELRDVFQLIATGGVFALSMVDSYRRETTLNKVILAIANIGFMGALLPLVIPFLKPTVLDAVPFLSVVLTFGLTLIKRRVKNKDDEVKRGSSERMTGYISLILGLLTIPCIAFLLRFNFAITMDLFSDETSYGVMSWGLLNGKLVGLHLPGPWLPPVPDFFKIEEYPLGLPLPYTRDWMHNIKVASPFFAIPYLCPLLSAPVIALFGFSNVTIRFVYVLMNVLSVLFTFLIGRHFSNRIGLLGAGILAVLSFSAYYGSKAFVDNGVLLFFVLTVFLYLKFKREDKRRYLYLAAISAGFCSLTKLAFGFLAMMFLSLALIFDFKKMRDVIRILLVSLGVFSTFIIFSMLVDYQGFVWSLNFLSLWYIPKLSVHAASWMSAPLIMLIFTVPELVFGLICVVYIFKERNDFTKLTEVLLLSTIVPMLIIPVKQWQLLPILPMLSLSIAKAISHSNNSGNMVLKGILILIFTTLATKDLPMIRELFLGFFAAFFILLNINRFIKSSLLDFLKDKGRWFDAIWMTFILILLATLYIQNMLVIPAY